MLAAIIPDKLENIELKDIDMPLAGPGQVLVRLHAAALNRRDWWIQQGQYATLRYPAIVGSDGAGVVETVGEGVDKGLVGQEVIINPAFHWGLKRAAPSSQFAILGMPTQGTLAQYVAVPAAQIAPKPAHLSWAQAAALPLAGLTAHRALFYRAGLQKGEKVLITGAGGGAAQLGLLFALAAGAEVWVTSSSQAKLDFCLQQGAKGGALYTDPNWVQGLKEKAGGFDVVLDSAGGSDFPKLFEVVDLGARISFFGGTAGAWPTMPPQRLFWKQVSLLGTTMGSQEDFADMLALVAKAQLVPTVAEVFPLEKAQAAFDFMGRGEGLGKIVLQIP
jgi:NADPH:quinone reductase-like Zn-dependent oxidoreductase